MQQKNQMLGSRVSKLETEREKLRNECERLDRQCEEMNATLSSPGQISRLWKWSLAQQWQQVSHPWEWEECFLMRSGRSEGWAVWEGNER